MLQPKELLWAIKRVCRESWMGHLCWSWPRHRDINLFKITWLLSEQGTCLSISFFSCSHSTPSEPLPTTGFHYPTLIDQTGNSRNSQGCAGSSACGRPCSSGHSRGRVSAMSETGRRGHSRCRWFWVGTGWWRLLLCWFDLCHKWQSWLICLQENQGAHAQKKEIHNYWNTEI